MASTADVAVQTDVSGVDVFERFVKTHRTLVLEWLNESDHVAVTVYDDETAASGGGGGGDRRRSPSTSSAASSCPSLPRVATDAAAVPGVATTTTVAERPPAGVDDVREWYPAANPVVATDGETGDGGCDEDDCGSGGGGSGDGNESIEMTHMAPAATAATPTGSNKCLKFHPFV